MSKSQVSILKGVAICMVVLIHILAQFSLKWWYGENAVSLLLVVADQFSRVSIPLFIFLSWYGLTLKYQSSSHSAWTIFMSRIRKLIPLYLIWSFGTYVTMHFIPEWRYAFTVPLSYKMILGQADYHLYFIPLIVMLYGLYALLHSLHKYAILALTPALLLLTWVWYGYLPTFYQGEWFSFLQPDQVQYLVPLTWLWYGWLGLLIGSWSNSKKPLFQLVSILSILATLITFGFVLRDTLSSLQKDVNALFALQFTRPVILGFATSMILTVWLNAKNWRQWQLPFLESLGNNSFLIYLSHTLLLRLTLTQLMHPIPWSSWLFGLASLGVLLALSFTITRQPLLNSYTK